MSQMAAKLLEFHKTRIRHSETQEKQRIQLQHFGFELFTEKLPNFRKSFWLNFYLLRWFYKPKHLNEISRSNSLKKIPGNFVAEIKKTKIYKNLR